MPMATRGLGLCHFGFDARAMAILLRVCLNNLQDTRQRDVLPIRDAK